MNPIIRAIIYIGAGTVTAASALIPQYAHAQPPVQEPQFQQVSLSREYSASAIIPYQIDSSSSIESVIDN